MNDIVNVWSQFWASMLKTGVTLNLYYSDGSPVFTFDFVTFSLCALLVAVVVWLGTLSIHMLTDLFEVE